GKYSTARNPAHTYDKAGKYAVSLTVSNAAGSNTVTKSGYIIVNAVKVPVAAFSASPTYGNAPLKVSFIDKSTGSPTSWRWSFGDGTFSTAKNPAHTYNKAGKYTVSLSVKNNNGINTATKSSYIVAKVLKAPVAAFSASPISGTAPLKVQFTDKSTGSPTSWKWNFGDGTSSTMKNPAHKYNKAGKYTVTLTAINSAGSNTLKNTNYVTVK
ncbi:MAG: PKD domain-containing protein, partial [Alphaproteobacteria bacterium]